MTDCYLVEYGIGGRAKTAYTHDLSYIATVLKSFDSQRVPLDFLKIAKVDSLEPSEKDLVRA
jgi:hypothetical protein